MTNNVKKIERFEKRVKTIEEHLAEIKSQIDTDKRQKEQNKISEDISLVKEEISEHLDELKKDVDQNKDEIKKLEELSKKVESFSDELDGLKDEILKKDTKEDEKKEVDKEEKEGTPSFFANIFYGGLIANTLGNVPLIGDSIKSWTEKKVKESAQDVEDEKSGKKDKPGFLKRIFKTVLWSGVATGTLWLGRKLIPDGWTDKLKSWMPWNKDETEKTDDKKDKEKKDNGSAGNGETPSVVPELNDDKEDIADQEVEDNGDEEDIVPLLEDNEELSPEEEKTTQEVQRMYSEGYSELYILVKMYQLGFVPKFNMGTWRGNTMKGKLSYIANGGPFTKIPDNMMRKATVIRSDMHKRMIGNIKYNKETLLQHKLIAIKNNNVPLIKEFDSQLKLLLDMDSDLGLKKINSLEEFETKYGKRITEKFGRKNFRQFQTKIETEFDKLSEVEKDIKNIENDIDALKKKAKLELDEFEKKTKAHPEQKAKFQAEAKNIVADYNKKILAAEKSAGLKLAKVATSDLIKLESKSPFVSKMMKLNNGVDNFAKKSKVGKIMIGVGVFSLLAKGVSGKESWEQVGLEAADLATGMVPFAGGAYDVWTSITGEGIAGQLGTTDRRIRGATGAVSVVLDVAGLFTFGLGNGASAGLKAAVKGSTKITKVAKAAKGIKTGAEVINTGMKIATYGFLGYTLVNEAKPLAVRLYESLDKKITSDIDIS